MPYDEPDPSDPSLLIGVSLPAGAGADLEMAYVFAEEFARLGFGEERLMRLFRHRFYAGAHRVWFRLGDDKIREVIREALAVWGRVGGADRGARPQATIHFRMGPPSAPRPGGRE